MNPHEADTSRNRLMLAEILAFTDDVPLVVVAGAIGSGRSTLLGQLAAAFADRGTKTHVLRLSPNPVTPSLHSTLLRRIRGSAEPAFGQWPPADLPPSGSPERAAEALADRLIAAGDTAILIDDAQWMDRLSAAVFDHLMRRLAGSPVRCVCAVRAPIPLGTFQAGRDSFTRLRADGLARGVALRPLAAADIAVLAAEAFEARPDPELVTRLRRLTAGLPAALAPILDQHRGTGSIRVVDGYAHLAPGHAIATLPDSHPLLMSVRRLGSRAWSVAKAVAVLYPLGDALPSLAGTTLGLRQSVVREVLGALCAAGVLRHSTVGGWRFRVPLLAATIAERLGPFERRQLAVHAVNALWTGENRYADPNYRADQLAAAGKLVEPERARAELLAHARESERYDQRWLRAAIALCADRGDRARTMLAQTAIALRHGDPSRALLDADALLAEFAGELDADEIHDLHRIRALAAHSSGVWDAPEGSDGDTVDAAVARATALLLRGRWQDAVAVLEAEWETWEAVPAAAFHGQLLTARAAFAFGDLKQAAYGIEQARLRLRPNDRHERGEVLGFEVLTLLAAGETAGVPRLFAMRSASAASLPAPVRAVLAMHSGQFAESLRVVRKVLVAGAAGGTDLAETFMHQAAATVQLAMGRLSRGRELLHAARRQRPPLPYLLDGAEALIDVALGQSDQARTRLREGLDYATEHGLLAGTDRLWRQLAELALGAGEHATAAECLDRLAEVAGPRNVQFMRVRSLVRCDRAAAAETVRLAREHGEPFELAEVIVTLVRSGLGDPALLTEAYDLLGGLGALLPRAWLRNLMAKHGVPVPGRARTVAENERLLAVLVADGLGNKQIATVLQASEKSVEGRLGRLFSHTAYRSRVELAMAVLTGAFPG